MVLYNIHSKYGIHIKNIKRLVFVIEDMNVFFDGLDRADSGYVQVASTCECGDELSGSIKCGKIFDYLKTG